MVDNINWVRNMDFVLERKENFNIDKIILMREITETQKKQQEG